MSRSRNLDICQIQLWDGRCVLGWWLGDMPGWSFSQAPAGLATRRQLRTAGLRPGGQTPYGQLLWRLSHRQPRWAWLYRTDLAQPKRAPTPAQLAALDKALAARRTKQICPDCGHDTGFILNPEAGRTHDCSPISSPVWEVAA